MWEFILFSHHCTGEGTDHSLYVLLSPSQTPADSPKSQSLLVASLKFPPFLILWCFEVLCLPLLVKPQMLGSVFSQVGEGLKPSATHIVITYSHKLSRPNLKQALQCMSHYSYSPKMDKAALCPRKMVSASSCKPPTLLQTYNSFLYSKNTTYKFI
jgi:hypothetical protein